MVDCGMGTSLLTYTPDVSRGAWIRERLGGRHVMGGAMPTGFDAYARIFHPGYAQLVHWDGGAPVSEFAGQLRWRDLAKVRGTVSHPLMQWQAILGRYRNPVHGDNGWQYQDPWTGSLPSGEFARVAAVLSRHTAVPGECTAGLWEGYGTFQDGSARALVSYADTGEDDAGYMNIQSPRPARLSATALHDPRLELPGRRYLLFDAPLEVFADPAWATGSGWDARQTPNQLWPADHSWFLASDVDLDSTVVGGSRGLIDELLASDAIEVLEIPAAASLDSDADTVNRPA